jgi:hypothetical protein
MDELIQMVARRAGISSAQSALAIAAMLAYLAMRLPSPVIGRIREQLDSVDGAGGSGAGCDGVK